MGSLAVDTAVGLEELGGQFGTYHAVLSEDWEIWGPAGGYIVSLMLRAAGTHTELDRPATLTCHFHSVASFAQVELNVETHRAGRNAESLQISIWQGDQNVAEAMVWAVADGLHGLAHDVAPLPDVASPQELEDSPTSEHPFWANLQARQLWQYESMEEWRTREAGEPVWRGWYRFVPESVFDDPWVEAGRLAILLDAHPWMAAAAAHREEDLVFVAPSLDVSIQFHRLPRAAEWLFVESTAPVADNGLIGGEAKVWAEDGQLLTTARQQMLCRPLT